MTQPYVREVSPEDVHAAAERGDSMCLVDVRQPWEYESHHIAGARLLPLGELPRRFASELDPADTVICICEHGIRSRHAADFLAAQSFPNVATMTGGMAEYPGPVETGPAESLS
jgi:rhodanese-related sulfurtransferase